MEYLEMSPKVYFATMKVEGKIPSLCVNLLEVSGYQTMLDVVSSTREEIMKIRNFGTTCLFTLDKAMELGGLAFGKIGDNYENTEMFKMAVGYLKSLGYGVILVKGKAKMV